jgi:hypothetical protein
VRLRFDTGLTQQDAEDDFSAARRRAALARIRRVLLREPDDVDEILPFDEVVSALGRVGQRHLGVQTIPVETVVGTVDRGRDFDRSFRPTSRRVRPRWERIARASRRGESMPPISVYRVGRLHFVRDGHHRVSVARALGHPVIDADVVEVLTAAEPPPGLRAGELPLKSHERVFFERVPLPPEARAEIQLSAPSDYARLAEGVEAWGFRHAQALGEHVDRPRAARDWLALEYRPIVAELRELGLIGRRESPTLAYMRVAAERWRLLRTHRWDDEVFERLRRELG